MKFLEVEQALQDTGLEKARLARQAQKEDKENAQAEQGRQEYIALLQKKAEHQSRLLASKNETIERLLSKKFSLAAEHELQMKQLSEQISQLKEAFALHLDN